MVSLSWGSSAVARSGVLLALVTRSGLAQSSGSSVLNDLRNIQFPGQSTGTVAGGGAFGQAQPGMMAGGMGLGAGGGMPMGAPGMPMGAPPMGGVPAAQAVSEPPEDLTCSASPKAAAWGAAKQHFRSLFSAGKVLPALATKEGLTAAMEGAITDLKGAGALGTQATDECGMGKLCLQLVSFSQIDDPAALVQLFTGFEQLASPVLTLLLDVPWAAIVQSGWPLFGLLAQLNLRRGHVAGALNPEEVDGLNDPVAKAFQAELKASLATGDFAAAEKASTAFLEKDTKGSALGPLTALAAQAAGSRPVQEKLMILQGVQVAFKQVIGSSPELDIAMGTQWPLWGLLHAAVEGLTV